MRMQYYNVANPRRYANIYTIVDFVQKTMGLVITYICDSCSYTGSHPFFPHLKSHTAILVLLTEQGRVAYEFEHAVW